MHTLISFCSASELAATASGPQWVHILPLGEIAGRDGRRWRLTDAAAVIAASHEGTDLPIDYEHQMHDPAKRPADGAPPAAGWMKQLEARPDGIWALVDWTPKAQAMVAAREYRYISPVFQYDQTGAVLRIIGAGLVHEPNLTLTALSAREDRPGAVATATNSAGLAQVAVALGLPAEAEADTILTAINRLKVPDPSQYMPLDAVSGLLNEHRQTVATMTEREVERKVEAAVMGAYITPAMRGWATALCRQNPDSFDAFIGSFPPAFAHLFAGSGLDRRPIPRSEAPPQDSASGIAAQLGLDPKRLG